MTGTSRAPRSYKERVFVRGGDRCECASEIVDRILAAVRSGARQEAASEAGGITREHLNRTLARGRREPDSPFGEFVRDYVEAEMFAARASIAQRKAELKNMQPAVRREGVETTWSRPTGQLA